MNRFRSIRFRLTVWYTAVLIAGLGLFSVLVWVSLRHQLMADIDQDLDGRASRLESYFRDESSKSGVDLPDELEEFCAALPPDSYVILRGAKGFDFKYPVPKNVAANPAPVSGEPNPVRMIEHQFSVDGESFNLDVGAPTGDLLHVLQLLKFLLWSLIPVVILIACAGGAWLSGRALKPVQDVTAAALLISIENLSDRVPVPPTGDELAQLAEVLNSMLGRLESAVKTLSQFVADASHELRTPLAVIRTTAELALRRGRSPESYRESLQSVVRESERMTRLVEELLVLARSDSAVAQMPRFPLDVRDVLQDVGAEMQGLAATRQIQIQSSLGEEPAIVSGNRPALHRLFLVLLDNAVKFSPLGGKVIVTIQRADTTIKVNIRDFGRGVRAADLPRIFERFYRSEPSPEPTPISSHESRNAPSPTLNAPFDSPANSQDRALTGAGHGLGLPLAESIAKAHGAAIEVHSVEGEGSTFSVAFPVRDLDPEQQLAAAKTAAWV